MKVWEKVNYSVKIRLLNSEPKVNGQDGEGNSLLPSLKSVNVIPAACADVVKAETVPGTTDKEVHCMRNRRLTAVIRTDKDRDFTIQIDLNIRKAAVIS
jgi:hypothetical protein